MDLATGDEARGGRFRRQEFLVALVSREGNASKPFMELFVLAGDHLGGSVSYPHCDGHPAHVSLFSLGRARLSLCQGFGIHRFVRLVSPETASHVGPSDGRGRLPAYGSCVSHRRL